MFYYIKGPLAYKDNSVAVIEAGGVGYKMTVSQTTYDQLPAVGGNATLYTHLSVREDGIELFGFLTNEELSVFRMLISVSGVGPKVAISLLSFLTPQKIALAIASDDKKLLSKATGVGAKTAARIILELHDKLSSISNDILPSDSMTDVTSSTSESNALGDAVEALSALGYTRQEINAALKDVNTAGMSLEEIFKAATKRLL